MFTGQVAVISNKATWASEVYELVDEDDGSTIDLSDSGLTVDIVVTIRDLDNWNCIRATASISNGKTTIPGPGFQWQFEDTDLSNLCAGTYRLGVKITIDGFIDDTIDGTIAVLEGN